MTGPPTAPPAQLISEGGPRQIDHSQLLADLVASAPQSAGAMPNVALAKAADRVYEEAQAEIAAYEAAVARAASRNAARRAR